MKQHAVEKPMNLRMTRENFMEPGHVAYWIDGPYEFAWHTWIGKGGVSSTTTFAGVDVYVGGQRQLRQVIMLAYGERAVSVENGTVHDAIGGLDYHEMIDWEDYERHYDKLWEFISEILPLEKEIPSSYSLRVQTFRVLAEIKKDPESQMTRIRDADKAAYYGTGAQL